MLAADREKVRFQQQLREEEIRRERERRIEEQKQHDLLEMHSSASDEGILTKESSTEELEIERDLESSHTHDSEE